MKFNWLKLLGAVPLLIDAGKAIGIEVDHATDPDSDGGTKITPDEGLALVDELHAKLRPVAVFMIDIARR